MDAATAAYLLGAIVVALVALLADHWAQRRFERRQQRRAERLWRAPPPAPRRRS